MVIDNNKQERIIIKAKCKPVIVADDCEDPREILLAVCDAIREGGYNPVSQLVGYIISEDPTHITNYKSARTLIGKIDRDDLLEDMVKLYIEKLEQDHVKKQKKNG